MKTIDSLGLLEVRGFTTAVEAADAMVKSARVRLLRQLQLDPGLISLVVEGDLAACRAAIDAGAAAAARVGEVISQRVIGAPDPDTGRFVLQLAERGRQAFEVEKRTPQTKPEQTQPEPMSMPTSPASANVQTTPNVPAALPPQGSAPTPASNSADDQVADQVAPSTATTSVLANATKPAVKRNKSTVRTKPTNKR